MIRVFATLLAIALLGADPSPVPSAGAGVRDRLPGIVGQWSCRNVFGATGTLRVENQGDAIVATSRMVYASRIDERRERYTFDPAGQRWRARSDDGSFTGAGAAWTALSWTLDGTISYRGGRPQSGHERFDELSDGSMRIARFMDGAVDLSDATLCRRGSIPPSESACVAPNTPPFVVRAALPAPPALGHFSGEVRILVSLDAADRVTDAVVQNSESAALNASALDAARGSIYRTARRDCRPVPSQYIFVADYN